MTLQSGGRGGRVHREASAGARATTRDYAAPFRCTHTHTPVSRGVHVGVELVPSVVSKGVDEEGRVMHEDEACHAGEKVAAWSRGGEGGAVEAGRRGDRAMGPSLGAAP